MRRTLLLAVLAVGLVPTTTFCRPHKKQEKSFTKKALRVTGKAGGLLIAYAGLIALYHMTDRGHIKRNISATLKGQDLDGIPELSALFVYAYGTYRLIRNVFTSEESNQ